MKTLQTWEPREAPSSAAQAAGPLQPRPRGPAPRSDFLPLQSRCGCWPAVHARGAHRPSRRAGLLFSETRNGSSDLVGA